METYFWLVYFFEVLFISMSAGCAMSAPQRRYMSKSALKIRKLAFMSILGSFIWPIWIPGVAFYLLFLLARPTLERIHADSTERKPLQNP